MKFDVLVVGASVIGGVAAKKLCEKGLSVAMVTDKPHCGKNGKCTSIISASGLDKTSILSREAVVHDIYGANVRCRGAMMAVRKKEPVARVLDRFVLDALSVGQAQDAGAELHTNARFSAWNGAIAETKAGIFEAKLLVGADGVASSVANACHFPPFSDVAVAWEGEFDGAHLSDAGVVDVFLDYPGLFAWIVPAGPKTVRVGLAVKAGQDLQAHKARFMRDSIVKKIVFNAKIVREFYHAIPLHFRKTTQKNNVALVGDAAGQVKATTGGGIVFGSLCAFELAEAAKHYVDGGRFDYESRWRNKYARSLLHHRFIRGALDRMPFSVAAFGLRAGNMLGLAGFLEKRGDMDFIVKNRG